MRRLGGAKLRRTSLAIIGLCLLCCTRADGPPNVIVITLDTLRADFVGAYGNPSGHTPAIDRLAAQGVVFERAAAPMGTTLPSHASLFTGLRPRRHGLRSNAGKLHRSLPTLAEQFVARGYETGAWVGMPSLLTRSGLHRGFGRRSDPANGSAGASIRSGAEVNAGFRDWLSGRESDDPFFVWLHYFEPHSPYPMTPYARRALRGYRGEFRGGAPILRFYQLGTVIPWSDVERNAIRRLYEGSVRDADRLVGEVLDLLDRRGLAERTVVVVTAPKPSSIILAVHFAKASLESFLGCPPSLFSTANASAGVAPSANASTTFTASLNALDSESDNESVFM